jgi:hypothetical protein
MKVIKVHAGQKSRVTTVVLCFAKSINLLLLGCSAEKFFGAQGAAPKYLQQLKKVPKNHMHL